MTTRRADIDALRGLMLVLMTVTHLPTRYSNWLSQPLGFVSSAEGFVFLSAYMVGMVYTARALQRGVRDMWSALWRRTRLVWLCQAAMLVFLFTLIAQIGLHTGQQSIRNLLSFYLADPVSAFWASLLLLYNPPLLDILPMYCLFMLVSPAVLVIGLRRNGWTVLIVASVVLWTLAQLGALHSVYDAMVRATGWKVPLNQTGAFEFAAWQLIWILGMWMGARQATTHVARAFPGWIVALAVAYAALCFVWRHAAGQSPFGADAVLNVLFDKWRLGPLRLVDLFALMVVIMHFGPRIAARSRFAPLEALGRASLPVFCAHVVAVLVVLAMVGDAVGTTPLWAETILLVAVLICLYVIALLSDVATAKPVPRVPQPVRAGAAV